jgi:enhancing lycopene biosynthesis protein 2
MPRAAMLLSGSGNKDGSEIHESVCAAIALDSRGWEIVFTAPDTEQAKTVSYIGGKELPPRNAMDESGRIARGQVIPLNRIKLDGIDAVVIPGGLGAVLTLCDFAVNGTSCKALPAVDAFLKTVHAAGIPIGAMCIAPALVARCLPGTTVTIGNHTATAEKIEDMGCTHELCQVDKVVVDWKNRVVTTPAYMIAKGPAQVLKGAESMVAALNRLIGYSLPSQAESLPPS